MNTDIRIPISFLDNVKRRKLSKALDVSDCAGFLIDLWLNTALNRPKGVLYDLDETDIAIYAGWNGDPKKFVDALLAYRFLEKNDDGIYFLHEWESHQGYASHAPERTKRAQKAARNRWNSRNKKAAKSRAQADEEAHAKNEFEQCSKDDLAMLKNNLAMLKDDLSNAPSPIPSPIPSPSPIPILKDMGNCESPFEFKVKVEDFIEYWNEVAPKYRLSSVSRITNKRERAFKARILEDPNTRNNLEFWKHAVELSVRSDLCLGNIPFKDGHRWKINFDWLIGAVMSKDGEPVNDDNLLKIVEGRLVDSEPLQRPLFTEVEDEQ